MEWVVVLIAVRPVGVGAALQQQSHGVWLVAPHGVRERRGPVGTDPGGSVLVDVLPPRQQLNQAVRVPLVGTRPERAHRGGAGSRIPRGTWSPCAVDHEVPGHSQLVIARVGGDLIVSGLHLVVAGGRSTHNIAKPLQASILVILLAALLEPKGAR